MITPTHTRPSLTPADRVLLRIVAHTGGAPDQYVAILLASGPRPFGELRAHLGRLVYLGLLVEDGAGWRVAGGVKV